ncbi:regulator of G-protein signaling rgs-1 [Caerostris extrusa]|uniref:Regulator of G-protein signaling rgs-1 n=1 Tax=Caerostris extrusa TaxID=172846 RepID=A0AAV4S446_CAEEX|nr:regulator of G-protein signaling rgs-1 [Caerostris extrusa]
MREQSNNMHQVNQEENINNGNGPDDRDRLTGRKAFGDFLRLEYSEENILFWQACEELKLLEDPEKIDEKARTIYEDYVSILSPKEVSLDSSPRPHKPKHAEPDQNYLR